MHSSNQTIITALARLLTLGQSKLKEVVELHQQVVDGDHSIFQRPSHLLDHGRVQVRREDVVHE